MLLEERSRRVVRVCVHEQNSLKFYDRGYCALPTIVVDAHTTREAAEAAWSKWRAPLHDLIVLCGRVNGLVTASICKRCQRPPVATSGS